MMQPSAHLTARDFQISPWKNGQGETTTLAVYPPGATLDDFIWRLSCAQVRQAGPFSYFAGVDRSLAVLEGALILRGELPGASDWLRLDVRHPPLCFSGEQAIEGGAEGEVALDLNMMTRRAVCAHHLQRFEAGQHYIRAEHAQQWLLYCQRGRVQLAGGATLAAHELWVFEAAAEHAGITLEFSADEGSSVFAVRIQFLAEGMA